MCLCLIDSQDVYTIIKGNIKKKFGTKWKTVSNMKKLEYSKVQPIFPQKKWFLNFPYKTHYNHYQNAYGSLPYKTSSF